jgi:hypothetical protein
MVRVCPQCNGFVPTPICQNCGRCVVFYERSPLQIAILTLTTCGLYSAYWIVRVRRLADLRLGLPVRPYWHYWGYLVPILNLYLVFSALSRAQRRVRASGVHLVIPYGVSLVVATVLCNLWPLPGAYWTLCWLGLIPLSVMHISWAKAERADAHTTPWPLLTIPELVIIVIGGLFDAAVIWQSSAGVPMPQQLTVTGVSLALFAMLAVCFVETKKLDRTLAPLSGAKPTVMWPRD